MKPLFLSSFVCVLAFVASAQPEKPAIKLTGIINLPDFKRALLEIQEKNHPVKWIDRATLAEGQRHGHVEVFKIDSAKGTVTVRDTEKETALAFESQTEPVLSTNTSNPTVRLDDADFAQVLDIYAELKGRTVLRPATLPGGGFSFKAAARDKTEATKAIEEEFLRRGITVIPDGEKFVMVVPASMAKEVAPHSPKPNVTPADKILPKGTINLSNIDVNQALMIYGGLIDRKFVRAHAVASPPISFRSTTPLTKDEAIYALDTLFGWNNISIVLNDDKTFTAISGIPPKKLEQN